ncbi:MAG: PstS family phosphate ABC transporter substrate-binding protein [Gemmatimonadetes bacterium]|nr:PstS family phosphate ABC transporter substrate-binding protein [Gemmatimonadota bacterium]
MIRIARWPVGQWLLTPRQRSLAWGPRLGALILAFVPVACGEGSGGAEPTGTVQADGSSTVFPVTEAVAEEFQTANPQIRVTVGLSGTGGGFSRFCAGETDISNASRPITDQERERCAQASIEFVEVPVAWDGLSVIVNPANRFVACLTVEELKRIWEPNSRVRTWRDVRSEWPAEEVRLYGPGTDSGTFDYFTEVIVGEARASRSDYQASEDDNVLVQGVAGDPYSLGYFGYAYYAENTDRLKLVGVDSGQGCVLPSEQTIEDGTYAPLSRPLFIYVKKSAVERPEVRAFVEFYLENAGTLVPATGYTALDAESYQASLQQVLGASPSGM